MFSHSPLDILGRYGKEELAILYVAKYENQIVEFVESIQPPVPREAKWVIIISTLYGCPIQCKMCDAGEYFHGPISKEGMLAQIFHIIDKRYPTHEIPIPKLKIQFARMGEPVLNPAVLDVIEMLPDVLKAPGLMPCISTVAPHGAESFLTRLLEIKNTRYPPGMFQLQFSIHSTEPVIRRKLITSRIWSLSEIQEFGERWYRKGDRKITLNFAVAEESIINPQIIADIFNPHQYFIKLTPINPTFKAIKNGVESRLTSANSHNFELAQEFRKLGFSTLISIGEDEENRIGSNCGQFATQYQEGKVVLKPDYTCEDYCL